jgi:tetrahydromethanopterin S-methyltransferase subunit E
LAVSTRRIALGGIFGAMILAVNGFIPAPTSDFLIVFQSFLLAISYLVLGRGGATYVGVVSGVLITAVKISFFPLDLVFSIMFGLAVDILAVALRAKEDGRANSLRLVICMMASTGIVGFVAYYVTAVMTNLVPNDFFLDLSVLIFGIVSGAIGGAVAARVWNRNLMPRFYNRY